MPYRKYARRRYARRGRGRGRSRMGPGGYDYNNLARKAMSGVKFLKSLINVEKKVWDVTANAQNATSGTSNCVWLSGITTGTGYNQRTGMVVKGSSLYFSLKIQMGASETQSRVRAILFRNKGLNQGATPTTADILQNATFADSPLNVDNVGDFEILGNHLFILDTVGAGKIRTHKFSVKLNSHIRWDVSGDLITDTEAGHIFLAIVGDSYTTNPPIYDFYSRLRFIDN